MHECTCVDFSKNLHNIQRAFEIAALDGIEIDLPVLIFCPWCGGKLLQQEPKSELILP